MNKPLKYVIGTTSKLKIKALEEAVNNMNINAVIIAAPNVSSEVNEQPQGTSEIFEGAKNRSYNAETVIPNADVYLAVENGVVFTFNDEWVDVAICLARIPKLATTKSQVSEGVVLPTEAVMLTLNKEGGFELNTVGKTLQEIGIVTSDKDPHLDLPPYKSRVVILQEAFEKLLNTLPKEYILEKEISA